MSSLAAAPLHILVADDQPMNLRIASRLLREMGHSGVLVTDGQQALQALKSQRFDLVLLDVMMPVLDGLSALKEIRQAERHAHRRHIPVIMVTAHDLPEDRDRAIQAGANGLLGKPLHGAALSAELQRILGR